MNPSNVVKFLADKFSLENCTEPPSELEMNTANKITGKESTLTLTS